MSARGRRAPGDSFLDRFKQMARATPRALDAETAKTLWVLFAHAHDDGTNIFVGVERLSEYTGRSRATVFRCLKDLMSRGYLMHDGWNVFDNGVKTRARRIDLAALVRDRALEDAGGTIATVETVGSGGTVSRSGGAQSHVTLSTLSPVETQTKRRLNRESEPKDSGPKSAQASLLPTEPEPQAAKPTAATKKPKPATAPPDGFEAWWAAYPHKVDKQDAAVEYAKALAEGIKPEVLLAALKAYPFSDEKHYQIHPKRWLSKRRWEATTVAPPPPPGQPWIPPRAGTAATQFTGHPWPTRPPRPGMRWIWATASYRQAREDGWCEVSNDTH